MARQLALAVSLAAALMSPAAAAPTTWTGTTGDWFSTDNWSNGVPVVTAEASVNNGGTAQASGTDGTPTARSLFVGAGVGAAQSGTVQITGANLTLGQSGLLLVGQATAAGAPSTGTLSIAGQPGSANVLGELGPDRLIDRFVVGFASEAGTAATGTVDISGNLGAQLQGRVGFATSNGAASFADGVLNVGGNLIGLADVGIARSGIGVGSSGAATATGVVTVGGNLTLGEIGGGLLVGAAQGNGPVASATGTVTVGGTLSTATGQFSQPSLFVGSAAVGTATGTLTAAVVDTSPKAFNSVRVGNAADGATATGTLKLDSGDLHVAGNIEIGLARGATGTSADGSVELGGVLRAEGNNRALTVGQTSAPLGFTADGATATGSLSAAGVDGVRFVTVGSATTVGAPQVPVATGTLELGSQGLSFAAASEFDLGVLTVGSARALSLNLETTGPGPTAVGEASVTGGHISGYDFINIGQVEGSGKATGTLELNGGTLSTRRIRVGFAEATGGTVVGPIALDAHGVLKVNNGSVQVVDLLSPTPGAPPLALGVLTLGQIIGAGSTVPLTARGDMEMKQSTLNVSLLRLGSGGSQGRLDASANSLITTNSLVVAGNGSRITLEDSELNVAIHPDVLSPGSAFIGSGGLAQVQALRSTVDIGANLTIGNNAANTDARVHIEDGALKVVGQTTIGSFTPGTRGELTLTNSTGDIGGNLRLGQSANVGDLFGDALLSLDASLLTLGGSLFTDVGAMMRFGLSGLDRGLGGYGAINAFGATLTGDLVIDFLLTTLLPDTYDFDLIVTDVVGAISGDFSAVSFLNLPTGYAVSYGVINVAGGGDIWRLSLRAAQVPEPASLALVAAALLALALHQRAARQRRRATAATGRIVFSNALIPSLGYPEHDTRRV